MSLDKKYKIAVFPSRYVDGDVVVWYSPQCHTFMLRYATDGDGVKNTLIWRRLLSRACGHCYQWQTHCLYAIGREGLACTFAVGFIRGRVAIVLTLIVIGVYVRFVRA